MKKKTKLLLIPTILVGASIITPASFILSSCSSTSSTTTDSKYNVDAFVNNKNQKFIDMPGMETNDVVKKIFSTETGIKLFLDKLAENKIFEWYENNTLSSVENKYQQLIKDSASTFEKEYESKSNSDIQLYLNENGGSFASLLYSKSINEIKNNFIDLMFSNFDNALAYKDGNTVTKIPSNRNDNNINAIFTNSSYVNGSTPGSPNSFVIDYSVINNNAIAKSTTTFVNYILDQWIAEELPLLTPSILYKHSEGPDTSGLFNKDFFGADKIGSAGSYKFQYFKGQNLDASSDIKNPSNLYTFFVNKNKNNGFVNANLGGAVDIDNLYTEDSSTKLLTQINSSYDTFVTPYASAVNYKFLTLLGTSDTNVPTATTFSTNSIMDNFLYKSGPTAGVFKFPYALSSGNNNAYNGDYSGVVGIKDMVNIPNTPWIMVRNEFGVHIIGIDRYDAIANAYTSGTSLDQKFKNVCTEIKNTLLYRAAYNKTLGDNSLDLSNKLKAYFTENFGRLVLSYMVNYTGSDNLFTNIINSSATNELEKGFLNKKIELTVQEQDLVKGSISLLNAFKMYNFEEKVKNKIYDLQKPYNSNNDPSSWKDNGLAGMLPFTRDNTTGSYNFISNTINFWNSNSSTTTQLITTAKNNYTNALNAYLTSIQPASVDNYFKDTGQITFTQYKPKFVYSMKPADTVTRYVYTNNFTVNCMLTVETSTDEMYNLFNDIVNANYAKIDNTTPFYDYTNMSVSNVQAQAQAPTFDSTNSTSVNQYVNYYINKAINEEYIVNSFIDMNLNNNFFRNGDWTMQNLNTFAYNKFQEQYNLNTLNDMPIFSNKFSKFIKFINTIYWLLSYDNTAKTYTFKNLKNILDSLISETSNNVGYFAWSVESNAKVLQLLNNTDFGTNLALSASNTKDTIINRDFNTNSYQKANNAIYLNNVNPYTYNGATNPFGTYPSSPNIDNSILNNYLGTNKSIYSFANYNANKPAGGFLGLQSPNSDYINNYLPNGVFDNQALLGQNFADPNTNYKGILYQYGGAGDLITKIQNMNSIYNISNFANQIYLLDLGLSKEDKSILRSIYYGVPQSGLPSSANITPEYWTNIDNLKTEFCNVVNKIPNQCFQKLDADFLWNNTNHGFNWNYGQTLSTTVFSSDSSPNKITEYIVTQFNKNDLVNTFTHINSSYINVFNNTILNVQPDAFFKSVIKIAMNNNTIRDFEVYIDEQLTNNKIYIYQAPLASKINKKWIKNSSDF